MGESNSLIQSHFRSVFFVVMMLFQFVTMDSISGIYLPFIRVRPWLAAYFGAIVFIVSIALMNMVMAVIVEGALAQAHTDRELEDKLERERLLTLEPVLRKWFNEMDSDNTKTIKVEEIDFSTAPKEFGDRMDKMSSLREFFELLDCDHSGELTADEFVDGVIGMCLSENMDILLILKLLRTVRHDVTTIQATLLRDEPSEKPIRRLADVPSLFHVRSDEPESGVCI